MRYIILTSHSITLLYVHRIESYVKTMQTVPEWSTWLSPNQSSSSIPPTLAHIIPPRKTSAPAKCPWPWHWKYHERFPRTCMSRHLVKWEPRTKGAIQQESSELLWVSHPTPASDHILWFPEGLEFQLLSAPLVLPAASQNCCQDPLVWENDTLALLNQCPDYFWPFPPPG